MFSIGNSMAIVQRVLADAAFAVIIAFIVSLLLASLSVAGVVTMTLAIIFLVCAWIVAIGATFFLTHLWNPSHAHRAAFAVILAVFFCGIAYVESRYQLPPPLLLEIQVGPTLSKSEPKETRFIAINNSDFPIVDMHYYCTVQPSRPDGKKGIWFAISVPAIVTINPKSSQGLYCGSVVFNFESVPSALWAMNLMFQRVPSGDTQFGAIFLMRRDESGEVKWIPEGTVTDLREAFQYLTTHSATP